MAEISLERDIMKRLFFIQLIAAIAMTTGCKFLIQAPVNAGDNEADVVAKRGQPTGHYQDGKDRILEYTLGPWGQKTYMARIDPNGKVVSFEQVLTSQKFATIKVGEMKKSDVLRLIGAPSETSYLSLRDLEVWSYPYKENDVWNSIMHVHFDKDGIVRQMLNGPDLRFDPDVRFPFGLIHR